MLGIISKGEKMVNIILGFVLIVIGVWGITVNWWQFVEFLRVLIPLLLVAIGLVAFLAGVKK